MAFINDGKFLVLDGQFITPNIFRFLEVLQKEQMFSLWQLATIENT